MHSEGALQVSFEIKNDGTGIDTFLKSLTDLLDTIYSRKVEHEIWVTGLSGGQQPRYQRICYSQLQLDFEDLSRYSAWNNWNNAADDCNRFYRIMIDILPEHFELEPYCYSYDPTITTSIMATPKEIEEANQLRATQEATRPERKWKEFIANQLICQRNNNRVYERLSEVLATPQKFWHGVSSVSMKPRDPRYAVVYLSTHYSPNSHDPDTYQARIDLGIYIQVKPIDAFTHSCGSLLSELAQSHFQRMCSITEEIIEKDLEDNQKWHAGMLFKPGDVRDELIRKCENQLREELNLPKIGEGFIYETLLANTVNSIYPDSIREFSPDWLGQQRLDIFIPSLNLALEYNGEQHYHPIEFFGGEDGFKKTKARDKKKRRLCKKNNVTLIEWKFTEDITESLVRERITEAMQ